jgi:hypothetical protein
MFPIGMAFAAPPSPKRQAATKLAAKIILRIGFLQSAHADRLQRDP